MLATIEDIHAELSTPSGPEPRVVTADVQSILRRVIRPGEDDEGESVSLIAEKANISTRTVYRVLGGATETISLALADALCVAADAHLSACRIIVDGEPRPYLG